MDVKAFLELFDRLAKVSTVYGKEDVLNAAALSRAILELSEERAIVVEALLLFFLVTIVI